MKLEFSRQMFEKYSSIKLHEISSSGRQVVPCRQTDTTKQTVTFHKLRECALRLKWQLHDTTKHNAREPAKSHIMLRGVLILI